MDFSKSKVAGAVGIALAAVCVTAGASWFSKGQPVPDWGVTAAKTATPDYARDANAVSLYDEYVETIDGSGRAVERHREAIRILKPQGRNNSCEVSYDVDEKINYFRAWTIAADEKNTYQAQDTDFVETGDTDVPIMLSTRKTRYAHPPAIDVGATIICESEELMAPYAQEEIWEVQDGIPMVYEALELDLPAGRAHSEAWHRFDPVKPQEVTPNHWRWEVKDVPVLNLRDVPSHPDRAALAGRMTAEWGDGTVTEKDQEWRTLGVWVTKLESDRPTPSPEITAKVNELIVGAPDFYTKLSRVTESIQKNIRYFVVERGIGGMQANHAADIFRNRYGDCKDKTTLLISMLQVAGIHAYYVPVDHRRGLVDPDDPSLAGDHMITAIEIPADVADARLQAVVKGKDGKRYLIFDPTDERTPVGNLPSNEQGGYGLLAAGGSSQVIALPVLGPDANGTVQKGAFTLEADGTLTGSVDTSHIGPEGGDLRMFLKYTDEKERRAAWETAVAHDVPGLALTSFQFVQPAALDLPLEFHYKLTATQFAHQAGPLLLVRPRVVGSMARPFDDKPRKVPIDLEATGRWKDSFDITLPAGYVVDETPDPVDVDMDFASYHSSITAKGNTLHYEREYVVKQVELPAERARDFRRLEGAILMDEKGTAVLKKSASGSQ
jgi:transglutaminase-like putative cysteine protease